MTSIPGGLVYGTVGSRRHRRTDARPPFRFWRENIGGPGMLDTENIPGPGYKRRSILGDRHLGLVESQPPVKG